MTKRVFLIVLDSFGVGELPDAADFGDEGSHTLRSCARQKEFDAPNLRKLGLFNIDGVGVGTPEPAPIGAFGKAGEASKGKDTTTGHWEISGSGATSRNSLNNAVISPFLLRYLIRSASSVSSLSALSPAICAFSASIFFFNIVFFIELTCKIT